MAIKIKKEKSGIKKDTVVGEKLKLEKGTHKAVAAKPRARKKADIISSQSDIRGGESNSVGLARNEGGIVEKKVIVRKRAVPVTGGEGTTALPASGLGADSKLKRKVRIKKVKDIPETAAVSPESSVVMVEPEIKPIPDAVAPKLVIQEVREIKIEEETPEVKVSEPVILPELKELELNFPVIVKDLAIKLQEKPSVLIKKLMGMGVMAGINQTLEESTVRTFCEKSGFKIKQALSNEELALRVHQEIDDPAVLAPRSPIVTLMGHVDHGKTSLLDAIRKTKVAESEHGGITQHIGAYKVHLPTGDITFLDTPGHEAFTAMRARGASVTDIVVLVVAADDGVMPQTKEAVDHARAAGVSIIVAINKVDKPQADINRIKKQLGELDLTSEDWGGKTIVVPVSAKTGQGIDNLLEMILLESQMLELKANSDRLARGVVIEAKMAKGKGPVATLLVRNGTLRLNDNIITGNFYGKIRAMFNHVGQAVTQAPPSSPVEILGLSGIPQAGEQFFAIKDEKQAKELVERRREQEKFSQIKIVKRISLEDLHISIKEGKLKELKLIIKADVQGSLEAIKDTIGKINSAEIKLFIIHEGVGNINTSDIILAVASNALVLGFNVVQDDRAKELSVHEGVDVKIYNIIYELANDIKLALEGMLEPKLKKTFLGKVEVRKVFKLSRSGIVAGCFVLKGKVLRSSPVNLARNGQVVFEGNISALKRFKDDVREVLEGFECGITLTGFTDFQEGDIIEAYEIEKIARKL
ncbi:MAG: translation initiation factor IF-2 [Candidatus Omnitrophota bacterium]